MALALEDEGWRSGVGSGDTAEGRRGGARGEGTGGGLECQRRKEDKVLKSFGPGGRDSTLPTQGRRKRESLLFLILTVRTSPPA